MTDARSALPLPPVRHERCGRRGLREKSGLLDKLSADQNYAFETPKVDATPTFFINGERLKGAMSFEEIDRKIKSLLKR